MKRSFLPILPDAMKGSTAENAMVQVIQDWQEIHKKFDEQLRPPL
jgi:hypothetical protein